MSDDEVCAFCRCGSCAIHGLRSIVRDRRRMPDDRELIPVGCCDQLQSAVFLGILRRDVERSGGLAIVNRMGAMDIERCPWCGARVRS